jgi:hypothetical protein
VSDATHSQPKVNSDLQLIAHQVHEKFDEQLDPRAVDECFNKVAASFDGATIRSFVPLLVRRYVNEQLHDRLTSA